VSDGETLPGAISLNGDGWTLTGWYRNQWRFTRSMELKEMLVPAVATVAARVPGSVHSDLRRAGVIPDVYESLNSLQAEWITNREWFYDRVFMGPRLAPDERLSLRCDGLDSNGVLYLNHQLVSSFSGMFEPVVVDLTRFVRQGAENLLRIVFLQPPEVDGQYGYTSRAEARKARFSYGWDWCPRNVPVGVWDDVSLLIQRRLALEDLSLRCTPTAGGRWTVDAKIVLDAFDAGSYSMDLAIGRGGVFSRTRFEVLLPVGRSESDMGLEIEAAEPWWPHGYGEQSLYDLLITVRDGDGLPCLEHRARLGLRTVRLLPVAGSGPSRAYTLEVNGRSIPMKGVNWVPASPFFGEAGPADYERLGGAFLGMGCNILRVWGGGIIEKRAFYDACDRRGMMVWQEFPLTSSGIDNLPNTQPSFLEDLRRVAGAYVRRARGHPSHVIWCGGNELMDEHHVPIGAEHPTIRVLEETAAAMDPGKPFLPTSPSGPRFVAAPGSFGLNLHHDVHGPWKYLGEEEHYRFFDRDDALLRTETGCPGVASADALRFHAGASDVWPPDARNPYWAHRGSWWLPLEEMSRLFGVWSREEFDRFTAFSRYLQAEALRYAAAATLRRWPRSAGIIIWMGNESFPNASNTSVLEFRGAAKPAYFALQRVFGSLFPGLAYPALAFEPGAGIAFQPFALWRGAPAPDCTLTVALHDAEGRLLGGRDTSNGWRAPSPDRGTVFFARVTARRGSLRAVETYAFCLREAGQHPPLGALRGLPSCRLRIVGTGGDTLRVTNTGSSPAVGLSFHDARVPVSANVDRGFLTLFPGESEELAGPLAACADWRERIRAEALNERVHLQIRKR